jgi:SPFH domain / Band 7 family
MVANEIQQKITSELGKRGITVEAVLLRDIQLPATLKASTEAKQQAAQEALAMNFRLQKETRRPSGSASKPPACATFSRSLPRASRRRCWNGRASRRQKRWPGVRILRSW